MKTIIWDWNGTLLDDAGIAVQADNILLARHGLPPVSLAWYRDHVEVPVERYYAKLFNLDQAPFVQLAQQFMEGISPSGAHSAACRRRAGSA